MERQILHVDMNNFYATVECMLDKSLEGKAVAVCGSVKDRHGIVLARNYAARAYGVKTAEAIWEARQKCPHLVIVPPNYEEYLKYSRLARKIYEDYTDRIEPYGMDECWLDVTGHSEGRSGADIADEIRRRVKFELGLTVSCGVSFNKVFAKLGSDMKKPDAVTIIGRDDFRQKIWHLPVQSMIGVGTSTRRNLSRLGVKTIGRLATVNPKVLEPSLKSRGRLLYAFANGWDMSPVLHKDASPPVKSVGHGTTTAKDLTRPEEVWLLIFELVQKIAKKLKLYGKLAGGISLSIRDKNLTTRQWQTKFQKEGRRAFFLAEKAFELFQASYDWLYPVRSVSVSAIYLLPENLPYQYDLFFQHVREEKLLKLNDTVLDLRQRFGDEVIRNASLLTDTRKRSEGADKVRMPAGLFTLLP